MEVANLVLQYVQVLAWPVVVCVLAYSFKDTLKRKLEDLSNAKTPVGEASFFDRRAKAVKAEAEEAVEGAEGTTEEQATPEPNEQVSAESGPPPGGPAETAEERDLPDAEEVEPTPSALDSRQQRDLAWLNYALPRLETAASSLPRLYDLAKTNPSRCIRVTHAELRRAATAALSVELRMWAGPVTRKGGLLDLLARFGPQSALEDLLPVAAELDALVEDAAWDNTAVSTEGALNYIEAAVTLARPLIVGAAAKLADPTFLMYTSLSPAVRRDVQRRASDLLRSDPWGIQ